MNNRLDFLEIGKIVKSHGLNGSVKVLSFLQSTDLLESLNEIFISQEKNTPALFRLKSLKIKGKCYYMDLEGISGIDQTEDLIGCAVLIPADKLAPLPEGEYYWQELIGLEVITEEGLPVGKVESIFPTGSNDVYVCSGGGREILLPAIEDVVRQIDLKKGTMVVRLPEGL